ncbi:MAG: tyrosine-protein phosphatase [Bacteroidota bacterium]
MTNLSYHTILSLALSVLMLAACGNYTKQERPERSLTEKIYLERNEDKSALVATPKSGFQLFEVNALGEAGDEIKLAADGSLEYEAGEEQAKFLALMGQDTFLLAERHIDTKVTPNIRDLGGLFTEDGYQVAWGRIFRSGKLSEVEEADHKLLSSLGMTSIVDFRSPEEVEEDPDKWPELDKINHIALPIGVGDNDGWREKLKEDDFDPKAFMQEANRGFVREQQAVYTHLFALLQDPSNYPLLYHCSAGKDRAGFASAMILSALGVDRNTIIEEYSLSSYYLHDHGEKMLAQAARFMGIDEEKLRPMMGVEPSYIGAAFEVIDNEYGGVDEYLCKELKVCEAEREKLRQIMLHNYTGKSLACNSELEVDLPEDCDKITLHQPLLGAKNFREISLASDSELKLKEGKLFRSDALHNLQDQDIRYLEDLGVKTIIDFRNSSEIADDPDKKIASVENFLNPAIKRSKNRLGVLEDTVLYKLVRTWFIEGEYEKVDSVLGDLDMDMDEARKARYQSFAFDYKDEMSTFMKTLTKEENYPVIFHCQGGKDRTGFASALLMKSLGFDERGIFNDFLTTNLYTFEDIEDFHKTGIKNLTPTVGAHKEHLLSALQAVEKEYGSFDNYLAKGLGLTQEDIASIKANLLTESK